MPVSSLGSPDANAPEILYGVADPELLRRKHVAHEATAEGEETFDAAALGRERRKAGGCWRTAPGFLFQTQHDSGANANPNDDIRKG